MSPPRRTPSQRWILAAGAILHEINESNHLHLGGAPRPSGSADAASILRSAWDIASRQDAAATFARLFESPRDERAAWNLGRAVNVVGWSYLAYLLDADTAWAWMKKSALAAQAALPSWKAFGESYLRGREAWPGHRPGSKDDRELRATVERLVTSKDGPWSDLPWDTRLQDGAFPLDEPRVLAVHAGAKKGLATLAAALGEAQDGDRIELSPGTYEGPFEIARSVEIVAGGKGEVVLESDQGPLVSVDEAGVVLVGLTLRTKKKKGKKDAPAAVHAGGGFLRLERCSVSAAGVGLDLSSDDADVQLDGCRVVSCGSVGAVVEGGALLAVDTVFEGNATSNLQIGGESQVTLLRTTVGPSEGTGVIAHEAARLDVVSCRITGNAQSGISLRDKASLRAVEVTFRDNDAAHVWLGSTGKTSITASTVDGGKGYGVQITAGKSAVLDELTVQKTALACVSVGGGRPTIKASTLSGSGQGGLFVHGACGAVVLDCRIENNAGGGVETRDGADPELVGCTLAGNTGDAFLAQESGRGRLTRCVLTGSSDAGVRILTKGDPHLLRCRIEGNTKEGVVVGQEGKGRFERCDIGKNDLGIFVAEGSAPVVRGGRIHDHKDDGILVAEGSKLTLEDCEVCGNEVNLRTQGADVRIARCRVHHGRSTGVFLGDGTRGVIEDTEIFDNADAGLEVAEGSEAKAVRFHVHGNASADLHLHDQGKGTFEDGAIGGGNGWAVLVEGKSKPKLRRMKIRAGAKGEISEEKGSKATLEDCERGAGEGFTIAALAPKPAPTDPLGITLARLDALLEKENPRALDAMNDGASDATLATLAKAVFGGRAVPPDVASFFRWHDGQSRVASFHAGDNRTPLSVAEAIDAWKRLSDPKEDVQEPWSKTWLPLLTNGAGDYLCVETSGARAGELVAYWHTEEDRQSDVATLEAWADATLDALERRR